MQTKPIPEAKKASKVNIKQEVRKLKRSTPKLLIETGDMNKSI